MQISTASQWSLPANATLNTNPTFAVRRIIAKKAKKDFTTYEELEAEKKEYRRSLELKSIEFEYEKGKRYKIAVKVVDIFGNDTMKIIEVGV